MLLFKGVLLSALLTSFAFAGGGSGTEPLNVINIVSIKSVYDGDTFRGYFDEHREKAIRIKGVDTPEIKGKCDSEINKAIAARDFLDAILHNASDIKLIDPTRDRYNRVLAQVLVDGEDLSTLILKSGHGRIWSGRRESWCN